MSAQCQAKAGDGLEILEISDCRLPGELSRLLADEISVQSEAGWRTGICHVNSRLIRTTSPFHPALADRLRVGQARLLLGGDSVAAHLTIVRHPAALIGAAAQLPPVHTKVAVIVAEVAPVQDDGKVLYDPASVEAVALELFGIKPRWAPSTPSIRAQLLERLSHADVTDEWVRTPDDSSDRQRHLARLQRLIPGSAGPASATSANGVRPARRRALFLTSNGAGMGHLTRLMAYARRLEESLEPHFLSLSQAVGVVQTYGMGYEYLPSSGAFGLAPRDWNRLFVARVLETLERIQPGIVVFDATFPYAGVRKIREARPGPIWVWSRRGMWKAEHDGQRAEEQIGRSAWFDAVLEPGDFAASYDRGITALQTAERVGPVTLLDRHELAQRAAARRALGLPATGPLALVSLGAGNINDTSGDVGAATQALRKLGVGICLTQSQIGASGSVPDDVFQVSHFPLSEYSRAFDLAVSAAGYNSFHEVLRFGVPTLFVPNSHTSLDDQSARARFAADNGLAHAVESVRVDEAADLLADLLANGDDMVARMAERDPGNGAAEGARFLVKLAEESESRVAV